MKKQNLVKRILVLMMAIVMFFPMSSLSVLAAAGDFQNVSTGLSGDIDTNDTISMPVKILDYEADGMLYEYAESNGVRNAGHFGATWSADFASLSSVSQVTTSMYGDFWGNTTKTLNINNSYASFLRATWAKNGAEEPHSAYGRTGVIMPNDIKLSMDNARYLVLVYRSNITNGKIGFFVERENADRNNIDNRVGDFTFTSAGTTNWTYAVYDLKQGNLAKTWNRYGNAKAIWTTLPMDEKGEYIDIAHAALFANKEQAEKFGEYALTDGSDRGDNRGFGLLRSSRKQSGEAAYSGIADSVDSVVQLNTYGDIDSVDFSTVEVLGYTLLGTFNDSGIANVGLLESTLQPYTYTREITDINEETGKYETTIVEVTDYLPVYKKEVVDYMAGLLQHSLEIPERTEDGWKNYRYVKGTPSDVYGGTDLATALRTRIERNKGSYTEANGKKLIGTWEDCEGNITSYYDAAYFLLNSLFVEDSYNTSQEDYDYLVMSAGTDVETGDKIYVFDGGFATSATADAKMAIDYDSKLEYKEVNGEKVYGSGTIQNTSAAGKAHFVYEVDTAGNAHTTTLNPFLPVTAKNNTKNQTESVYYQDDGVLSTGTTKDTYVNRNFNFALKSSGEFVYYADDELFFEFEGDDDVYLFVNGELLMDIGSAHSIDSVRFELNDYVNAAKAGTLGSEERNKALALEEGDVYHFAFFYMERHGYGSNMRINTNIHITDPQMITEKVAWQNGVSIDYGSIVDKSEIVEYGFAITNTGNENLYNLSYRDKDIGVSLDPVYGLSVTGDRVYDLKGGKLEPQDLTVILTHPSVDDITVTFENNNEIKQFLTNIQSEAVLETRGGLWKTSRVLIRGIGYKLSNDQIEAGVFDNTVFTTSTNYYKTRTLQGQAKMRVFVPADPMYYQWAGHELKVTKSKLIEDILAAAKQEDNILNGQVPNLIEKNVNEIEFTTSAGNPIIYQNVTMDGSYNLTLNYPTSGSYVFYVKITYNNNKNTVTVPVLVNVTSVENSVFVLDYGLKADLTSKIFDLTKDKVTVPGRNTEYFTEGITATRPSYSPNSIAFEAEADGIIECTDGTYTWANKVLSYQPTDFMQGLDAVWAAVRVKETDYATNNQIGTVDINNEVEMFKDIVVLPANVVYYEDDFPAITYPTVQNIITEDATVTNLKNVNQVKPDQDPEQGADQEENYGHDNVYQVAGNTSSSGGSLTTLTIYTGHTTGPSFKFNGTGFELISRTTAEAGATIYATVTAPGGTVVKRIPVITEFDNGADGGTEKIHQVPIIRVNDLPRLENGEQYTVTITGVLKRDYSGEEPVVVPSYLYIDGLRIYQPLGATNENYTPEENGAEFDEIRDLIADSKVAVAEYEEVMNDDDTATVEISISSGTTVNTQTWVENRNGDAVTKTEEGELVENVVSSVDEYLMFGPNNEVYMEGTNSSQALVFYVKETGDESAVHNLQIAMRGLDRGKFMGTEEEGVDALVQYAVMNAEGSVEWTDVQRLVSSTEQYYTIDYTKCPYDEETGYYQVVVTVVDANCKDAVNSLASFSTIKHNNLDFVEGVFDNEVTVSFVGGLLQQNTK